MNHVEKVAALLGHRRFEIIKVTKGSDLTEQGIVWVKVKDFVKDRWIEVEIIGDEARIITTDSLV